MTPEDYEKILKEEEFIVYHKSIFNLMKKVEQKAKQEQLNKFKSKGWICPMHETCRGEDKAMCPVCEKEYRKYLKEQGLK